MQVDLHRKFKKYDGEIMDGPDIANVVASLLFNYGNESTASKENKYRAYQLSQNIMSSNGLVQITVEDASLIKEICSNNLLAGPYGQLVDILEANEK